MSLSIPYLAQLADKVHRKYGTAPDKLALLFPTRTAAYVFRKYMGQQLAAPQWAPATYTLPAFMQFLYPKAVPSQLVLCAHLHHVWQQKQQKATAFAAFYPWGSAFLRMLEEIAQYGVSAELLFTKKPDTTRLQPLAPKQQQAAKRFWDTFLGEITPMQTKFLQTWECLPRLYKAFHKHLLTHDIGYRGLHYQQVYEQCLEGKLQHLPQQIIAIGLHPLTPLVQKIIHCFRASCQIAVDYDVDAYYMEHPKQEAGYHLRQYREDSLFGKNLQPPFKRRITANEPTIKVIQSPTQIGQARLVAATLASLIEQDPTFKLHKTAIILSDTALLTPLLNALPATLPLSIQLDYPLAQTPIAALLSHVLAWRYHYARADDTPAASLVELLTQLLHHPYMRLSAATTAMLLESCRVCPNDLQKHTDDLPRLWQHILMPPREINHIVHYLTDLLALLAAVSLPESPFAPWERASINKAREVCQTLGRLPLQPTSCGLTKAFTAFFTQQIQKCTLPISSAHSTGIQVSNWEKTQLLDFDQVFVLAMNEGIFPSSEVDYTILPASLREAYGLPTIKEAQAHDAYLFYGLLQRAKTVWLLYDTGGEAAKREVSRYIRQLQYERGTISFDYHALAMDSSPTKRAIAVRKDKAILNVLASFAEGTNNTRALTPSAINTYLDCRLRFYFRYIAQLKTPSPQGDITDPVVFGQLLHAVMERLYRAHVGRVIDGSLIKALSQKIAPIVQQVIRAYIAQAGIVSHKGMDVWLAGVLSHVVKRLVAMDGKRGAFTLLGLEVGKKDGLHTTLPRTDGKKVRLGGIIDRIDHKAGVVHIIDYKTAPFNRHVGSIEALFDNTKPNRNSIALQVLWYAWLYAQRHAQPDLRIQPCVISVGNLSAGITGLRIRSASSGKAEELEDIQPYVKAFEAALRKVLDELWDREQPFDQTTHLSQCVHCPYKGICQR